MIRVSSSSVTGRCFPTFRRTFRPFTLAVGSSARRPSATAARKMCRITASRMEREDGERAAMSRSAPFTCAVVIWSTRSVGQIRARVRAREA